MQYGTDGMPGVAQPPACSQLARSAIRFERSGGIEMRTDTWQLEREDAETLTKAGMCAFEDWWAQQDSNLRPRDYESPALTN